MIGKPSVLIVDDEPDVASILQMFLEEAFDVDAFSDPRLASTEIESKSYDLIVSDIRMPHMTGYDMVTFVKRVSPSTPIVLMTGHAQSGQDIAFAHGLGASRVICKPFGDMTKVVSLLQCIVAEKFGGLLTQ